jgi:hypothetical protein
VKVTIPQNLLLTGSYMIEFAVVVHGEAWVLHTEGENRIPFEYIVDDYHHPFINESCLVRPYGQHRTTG